MRILIFLFFITHPIFFFGQNKTKLVVGIVVDQMRYDYLKRFERNFSKNGFKKLLRLGSNCTNVNYNYVPTYTGPGHASIYTGTTPKHHGIIANDWYNRSTKRLINCVEDKTVETIGSNSIEGQFSPKNLLTSTITDQLKLSNNKSKVISISIKNRGAILPGGHLSDGSYWYDYSSGKFITSSYYKETLPDWLLSFNEKNNALTYLKDWNLMYKNIEYQSVDNSPYEIILEGKSKPCFPYEFSKMSNKLQMFPVSPEANTLLTDLAMESILKENLGTDYETDFLAISYSSTDIVGHLFGTDSREIEDMYYRLDQNISDLIKFLDKHVGKNRYTVFITADHGAVPVPQKFIEQGVPGGYFFTTDKIDILNKKIQKSFNHEDTIISKLINNQLYYDWNIIKKNSIDLKILNSLVKKDISNWEGVKEVYSSKELDNSNTKGYRKFIDNGFKSNRSGDIAFILEFGYLSKSTDSEAARKGTSHGSPYNYDTHVPLLFYGNCIPKRTIRESYEITDIAPTLTQLLNIQSTGSSNGKPILEIFQK